MPSTPRPRRPTQVRPSRSPNADRPGVILVAAQPVPGERQEPVGQRGHHGRQQHREHQAGPQRARPSSTSVMPAKKYSSRQKSTSSTRLGYPSRSTGAAARACASRASASSSICRRAGPPRPAPPRRPGPCPPSGWRTRSALPVARPGSSSIGLPGPPSSVGPAAAARSSRRCDPAQLGVGDRACAAAVDRRSRRSVARSASRPRADVVDPPPAGR